MLSVPPGNDDSLTYIASFMLYGAGFMYKEMYVRVRVGVSPVLTTIAVTA